MEGTQLVAFLGALALLLLVGRAAGELARRAGQPEVLGTLASGVLLGPSVLGAVAPDLQHALLQGESTGPAFSGLSNLGAVLLLLVAGLEVDLRLLRRELKPGLWVAATAIVPSVVAGALVGRSLGLVDGRAALYMGVVLSVTAVSVVSTLLIEAGETRRRYAQVILAGGVAAEVVCWVLVSAVAGESGSPLASGGRSVGFAAVVFVCAYFGGKHVVPKVMRLATDHARVPEAPLTAVLVLALAAGTGTAALGLHPLLGAFIAGVLLRRAPRTNVALLSRVEGLVISLFAPVFFVLAGARVDLRELLTATAALQMLGLLALATAVKVGPVALGARFGGLRGSEPWVVAVGMNLKGGTDVLVAILGQQLHVLSVRAYTQYAVVALLTVLISPTVLSVLRRRLAVSPAEQQRLAHEAAEERSYLPELERVLVPVVPELRPSLAADVVDRLARTAEARDRVLDVTGFRVGEHDGDEGVGTGMTTLTAAAELRSVQLRDLQAEDSDEADLVEQVVRAAQGHDLLAIGVGLDVMQGQALGPLQNRLIDASPVDVLVAAAHDHGLDWDRIRRILVPTNGTPHARAAAEVAARLAETCDADVVLLSVVNPELEGALSRRSGVDLGGSPGTGHLESVRFLLDPVDVDVHEELRDGDPAEQLREALASGAYDLVVMGAVDQAGDAIAWLGGTVEVLLSQHEMPYVLLVTHDEMSARVNG